VPLDSRTVSAQDLGRGKVRGLVAIIMFSAVYDGKVPETIPLACTLGIELDAILPCEWSDFM
jgi:hypothetical protein